MLECCMIYVIFFSLRKYFPTLAFNNKFHELCDICIHELIFPTSVSSSVK